MAWTWTYHDADGVSLSTANDNSLTATDFPTQADAEAWVGEAWHDLVEDGVDSVCLLCDGASYYGPMSLRPAE